MHKLLAGYLGYEYGTIHAQHFVLLQKNVLPEQPIGKPPLSGRETLLSLLYMHLCYQFPALSNLPSINAVSSGHAISFGKFMEEPLSFMKKK